MSGGVDIHLPGDTIRRRPQMLYLPTIRHHHHRRPSTTSTTTLKSPTLDHPLKLVTPSELDSALNSPLASPLVLDCRATFAFGRGHVTGAAHLRCSDRLSRRRLRTGRLGLVDLVSDDGARERLLGCRGTEVVLYDEGTTEAEQVTEEHPLSPVIASIREMGARPVLLRGERLMLF